MSIIALEAKYGKGFFIWCAVTMVVIVVLAACRVAPWKIIVCGMIFGLQPLVRIFRFHAAKGPNRVSACIDSDEETDLRQLIQSGKILDAIKRLRMRHPNISLVDAKDYIESLK